MKIRALGCFLVLLLAVAPLSAAGEDSIDGVWKKMRANPLMGDNLFRINLAAKTVSFTYRGYGKLECKVLDVAKDMKTSLPRYTLKVSGRAGTFTITVVRFDASRVYIGGGRSGWKLWGTYTPAAQ